MLIDNVTHPAATGLLIFLRKAYGNTFTKSCAKIAEDYANSRITKWKVREWMRELEKMGYLKASKPFNGNYKRYTIDEDHYRALVWLTEDGGPLKSFYGDDNSTDGNIKDDIDELTESDNEDIETEEE